jgi:hypothetical protein
MMPFIVVLLILTAASEFAPALVRMVDLRAIMALAADTAIWILVFIYFNPQNAIEDYPPLGRAALLTPGVAMFFLFAVSVTVQTVLRGRAITIFAAVQTTIAFLLAAVCLADFGSANGTTILGIACLVLSTAIYAGVFTVFQCASERRNAVVFSAWAAGLFLAGSFLCLPPQASILLLGAGAVTAAAVGHRNGWLAFELYGTLFLLAAAALSGFLRFLVSALIGTAPGIPLLGVWLTLVWACLCYAVVKPREGEPWAPQVLHLLLAALLAGGIVALLIQGLFALVAGARLRRRALASRGVDSAGLRRTGAGRGETGLRGSAPRPPRLYSGVDLPCCAYADCSAANGKGETKGLRSLPCPPTLSATMLQKGWGNATRAATAYHALSGTPVVRTVAADRTSAASRSAAPRRAISSC